MFNDPISTALVILAVILAVVAGLWFGSVLGDSAAGRDKDSDGKPRKRRTFGKALQNAATANRGRPRVEVAAQPQEAQPRGPRRARALNLSPGTARGVSTT